MSRPAEIQIVPLSPENFDAVIQLKVDDHQAGFVAPNVLSIAQSKIWSYLIPEVIVADLKPVGFALHGRDPETGRVFLVRLMIDRQHQRQGHASAAMHLLIPKLRETHDAREIYLSIVPGNTAAVRLYQSCGFLPTGDSDEDGEEIFRLG